MVHNTSALTLYEQLADDLRSQIREGTLAPGDRLPSVRKCAGSRGVSMTTVLQAYGVLEDGGWINARPKSGYFVAPPRSSQRLKVEPFSIPKMLTHSIKTVHCRVLDKNNLIDPQGELTGDPGLGAAIPDPGVLPAERLSRLHARAVREFASELTSYPVDPIFEGFARALARRTVAYPVTSRPEDYVATAGCIEGINLALRSVAKAGDTVIVESPAYFGVLEILDNLGIRAVPVCTCPQDGICLDATRRALEKYDIKAIVVSANCQNPLGFVMSECAKRELLSIADDYGVPIIEDDINGDLCFDLQHRPRPIKAFDEEGSVIYVSSFSKTLSPGLRIGWALPGRYQKRFLSLKEFNTMGTPTASQAALAAFLDQGGFDRHLRNVKIHYKEKAERLREALMRVLPPESKINMPSGGLVLWVALPKSVDAEAVSGRLLEKGIRIPHGGLFSPHKHYRNCLRLAFGPCRENLMTEAVRMLGLAVREQLEGHCAK